MPITPMNGPSATKAQVASMTRPANPMAAHRRVNAGFRSALFHDSMGPTAMAAIIGIIKGSKTDKKTGGPTHM